MVVDPSTSAGLAKLAASEGAQLILFGSDYRTPPGRVEPGGAAQGLLEGSPVAIGVAAAGLRTRGDARIQTISVAGDADGAAHQSAEALAQALGADILDGAGDADLILVDSQSHGPEGQDRPGRADARAAGLGARVGHRAAARPALSVWLQRGAPRLSLCPGGAPGLLDARPWVGRARPGETPAWLPSGRRPAAG